MFEFLRMTAPVKSKSRFRIFFEKLLILEGAPSAVAGGVASGVSAALTPFFGIKFFLALALSRIVRGNVAAAALTMAFCNVIVPALPFIMALQYALGCLLMGKKIFFPADQIKLQNGWRLLEFFGWPLLLGSLVSAAVVYAAVFFAVRRVLLSVEKRRALSP